MREIAEANERKYNPQGLPDDQKDRDEEVERGLWAFRSGMFGMVFDDDFMPSSTIDQC